MKLRLPALCALVVLTGSALAFAGPETEIKAVYAKIVTAMKARDQKAIMAVLTKDFQFTTSGSKLSRVDFEKQLKAQMGMKLTIDALTMDFSKIKVTGNTATVDYVTRLKGKFPKPEGKGKASTIDTKVTARDTWVKNGKVWMIKKMESIKDETLIDGKPFGMTGG